MIQTAGLSENDHLNLHQTEVAVAVCGRLFSDWPLLFFQIEVSSRLYWHHKGFHGGTGYLLQ